MNRSTFLKLASALMGSIFAKNKLSAQENPQAETPKKSFKFTLQPYITSLTNTEGFIVLATNKPSVVEVETIYEDGKKRKFYASHISSGIKHVGNLHSVRIKDLKAGEIVQYQVKATEVITYWACIDKIKGRFKMGETIVYNGTTDAPLQFKVPNASNKIEIGVVTDIHGRAKHMCNLLIHMPNPEMLIMTGDMDHWLKSHEAIEQRFLCDASDFTAGKIPLYWVRGNHECRGALAEKFFHYAPYPDNKTYCAFRQGPIFFLMLDSCEMNNDKSATNGGFVDLVSYQKEEAEWLQEVVKTPEFKEAPFRVIFQHIPLYTEAWPLSQKALAALKKNPKKKPEYVNPYNTFRKKLFYDNILKDANIDLLVCGHLHRYVWVPASEKMNFPTFVCSNEEASIITADNNKIQIKIIDQTGKQTHDLLEIKAKGKA
ncbi:MAG: hypothetical protein E7035_01695 [Verrucomicrobiaceae bacterium]|nr:hypothetical protein [Verrucomicrobiaceae bacterium]